MAQHSKALTELVRKVAGPGGRMTQRALAEASVDPTTGYSPSKSLIGKIINDMTFKVTPELISALAVGTGFDRSTVAQAAHEQYIGYEVIDPFGGAGADEVRVRVAHSTGAPRGDSSKTAAWFARKGEESQEAADEAQRAELEEHRNF